MSTYSIARLERLVTRAADIYEKSDNEEIDVAGEELVAQKQAFDAAEKNVVEAVSAERKERNESSSALGALAKKYDSVRGVVALKLPHQEIPGRASSFATSDDLLTGAEKIEDILDRVAGVDEHHPIDGTGDAAPTGEAWALKLLKGFQPVLSAAVTEYKQSRDASKDLQKAQNRRELARTTLEQTFLDFRRIVRDVFGASSREYQSLRTRSRADDDPADEPAGDDATEPATEPAEEPVT